MISDEHHVHLLAGLVNLELEQGVRRDGEEADGAIGPGVQTLLVELMDSLQDALLRCSRWWWAAWSQSRVCEISLDRSGRALCATKRARPVGGRKTARTHVKRGDGPRGESATTDLPNTKYAYLQP